MSKEHARSNLAQEFNILGPDGHILSIEEVHREVIRRALTFYGQNKTEVAKNLGMSRGALYQKLGKMRRDISEFEITPE